MDLSELSNEELLKFMQNCNTHLHTISNERNELLNRLLKKETELSEMQQYIAEYASELLKRLKTR